MDVLQVVVRSSVPGFRTVLLTFVMNVGLPFPPEELAPSTASRCQTRLQQ